MNDADIVFALRKIFARVAFDKGLNASPEQLNILYSEAEKAIYLIFTEATTAEEVVKFPDNNLTRLGNWWHKIKSRSILLRRLFKLYTNDVWMVAQFPDIKIPPDLLGAEFVSFRIIRTDEGAPFR